MAQISPFSSFRFHNYRLYFFGQAISLLGTWIQRTATSWLVYRITNSAFMLGIITFAFLIPIMILSPYGGAISDNYNKYKILLITQVLSMLQAGVLAFVVLTGHYNIATIATLSVCLGIINAFDTPARQSLVIYLIDDPGYLANAIALNSSMLNFARLIGPAIAGIIINHFSEGICFLINFISFIAVISTLLLIRVPIMPNDKASRNTFRTMVEGYKYLISNRDILIIVIFVSLMSLFVAPFITMLPVLARETFKGGAGLFSLLSSFDGLGALSIAIYLSMVKSTERLLNIMIIFGVVLSISLLFIAYSQWLPLTLTFIYLSGAGLMSLISITNTYIQLHSSGKYRASMISYYVIATQGVLPIGSLIVGIITHHLGLANLFVLQSLFGIIFVFLFYLYNKKLL
ncbi:MAG: MFS transporter [Solitalea-like symbiont of Tyrophagus putrescentiae]